MTVDILIQLFNIELDTICKLMGLLRLFARTDFAKNASCNNPLASIVSFAVLFEDLDTLCVCLNTDHDLFSNFKHECELAEERFVVYGQQACGLSIMPLEFGLLAKITKIGCYELNDFINAVHTYYNN